MASRLQDVLLQGVSGSQPLATTVAAGTLYFQTDTELTEQSDGTVWSPYSATSATLGINELTGDVTAGPGSGSQAATIAGNAVGNTKLRDSGALSVIGRSANSTGDPADISAVAAGGAVLRESGSTLGFGTVATAGLANDSVTYAKIQNIGTTDRLLGLDSAAPADTEEIAVASGIEFTGSQAIRTTVAVRTQQIGITVDGGGSVITAGVKGFKSFPVAGTITGWRLLADAAGTVEFDIQKSTYAGFPPTVSIIGSSPVDLAGVQVDEDTTLTGWTIAVAAGDVFEWTVKASPAPATITRVTLELTIVVT